MNQLPVLVLKGYHCVGAPLCSLCVPSGFGGRARSEVSKGYVFPLGVLAVTTLVGWIAVDEGTRARARCELEFLLLSVASLPYQGWGWVPRCWSRRPEGWVQVGSALSVYLLPCSGTSALVECCARARGAGVGAPCRLRCVLG